VNALGPDLEGLDTHDRDELQEDVDKAIERVDKKLEDIEDDLEKREDDLNDDLENTKQRKAAQAKLDQLEEDLRTLRRKLSDIRSAAVVGINPSTVLDQVHALDAGILAIEDGIDELDKLVKAAEKFKDDDD
jgi:DNA repair exonuclease SbcCD ATPase subunit